MGSSPEEYRISKKIERASANLYTLHLIPIGLGAQLEYPRDMVLNHVLLNRGILGPGHPLDGLLLARGGPMPVELRHGQVIKLRSPLFRLGT